MVQDHRLQRQRFELKYLVPERILPQIRDFIDCHLDRDDYGRDGLGYPVHSLYLDSDTLKTYVASLNGEKNRFKLRLRFYDENPATPVFCEIKGRVDNCILKQRCGIRKSSVEKLLAGHFPDPADMVTCEPRHWEALNNFHTKILQLGARPKAHNFYIREAWLGIDNSARVTIDRNITIEPCFQAKLSVKLRNPGAVFPATAVLELKFMDRFPRWFQELVEEFNLMQGSASKYADGIKTYGEHWFYLRPEAFEFSGAMTPGGMTNGSAAFA